MTIAYSFGWRMQSEVLALETRQVDPGDVTIRLDRGRTNSDEGLLVYLSLVQVQYRPPFQSQGGAELASGIPSAPLAYAPGHGGITRIECPVARRTPQERSLAAQQWAPGAFIEAAAGT